MFRVKARFLANEPILIASIYETFDFKRDAPVYTRRVYELLDSHPEPVFLINDISKRRFEFQEAMAFGQCLGEGDESILVHPNMYEALIITQFPLEQMVVFASKKSPTKSMKMRVFHDSDEALVYVRERLSVCPKYIAHSKSRS